MERDIWNITDEFVTAGDLDGALSYIYDQLKKHKYTEYHQAVELDFTNTTASLAWSINKFIDSSLKEIDLKAVYLEMNGFYINPDRWYFDFFGYSSYNSDPEDLDWLSDWQTETTKNVTLTGMESLQMVYKQHLENDNRPEELTNVITLSDFVVTLKFMRLIQKTLTEHTLIKAIPLLCTAHDYDIIYRHMMP